MSSRTVWLFEDQRHPEAVAELHSERRELDDVRAAIQKPLADSETRKQRLAAVLGERSSTI